METLLAAVLTGTGATALIDVWSVVRKHAFCIPLPDYGLLGRWIAHMRHGRFRHHSIKAAAPVRHERLVGWIAHYLTGVGFACALIAVQGTRWILHPTLCPALLFGVATVAAPFLLMQPGMGAGIAARRTPHPASARTQSLITHALFGVGLYIAARGVSFLYPTGD